MNVQIIVKVDGREVADVREEVSTSDALELEQHTEQLKDRAGRVILEVGLAKCADQIQRLCCCGQSIRNQGQRLVTVTSQSGPVTYQRTRFRDRTCGAWRTPVDAVICCRKHRITRPLARNICQLATLEHFTRLERLVGNQHGVCVGHDPMLNLAHDVGELADLKFRRLSNVGWVSEA